MSSRSRHERRRRRWLLLLTAAAIVGLILAALATPSTHAASSSEQVAFGTPTGTAVLGSPFQVSISFQSPAVPTRVEFLSHLPSTGVISVEPATVTSQADDYTAGVTHPEFVMPNSTFVYQFRVTLPDGTVALSPEANITVQDTRFAWQTLEGDIVRLHWYDGDQGFAQNAVSIGDDAIHQAEQLLGVTESDKVDFFIYDAEGPFRDALGPGTRENVGGTAVASIRTLFGLIEPSDINSDWVRILVTHELTHLVFDTAVGNPYHLPPRWLNEGLAVYLSEGDDFTQQLQLQSAIDNHQIIPLDGLGGLFPTGDGFGIAYAEAVSAVSYLVETYGKDALVTLIRSYSAGVTDDEAFSAAIGRDLHTFGDEWLASIGTSAPAPLGPQPAAPGPLPPDWTSMRFEPPTALLR